MKTRFILLITVFFVCCVFSFVETRFTRFSFAETRFTRFSFAETRFTRFQAALAIQNDLKTE